MKICIPSKGRAHAIKTHLFFNPVDVLIFVEPTEIAAYRVISQEYTFIDIKESNQGISYARNFILDYMKDENFVMMDDDINYFSERNETGHYTKLFSAAKILRAVEEGLNIENCAIYSLVSIEENTFAYAMNMSLGAERNVVNHSQIIACYGFNMQLVNTLQLRFDENISEGEDADFLIRTILSGADSIMDYNFAFSHDIRTPGGLSFKRNAFQTHQDCAQESFNSLTKKHGTDIISISRDSYGDFKSMKINFAKLIKIHNSIQ